MWVEYNPNPYGRHVGDCAIRAVSAALNIDWDDAFALVTEKAFQLKDMPSSDAVWSSVLRDYGFVRKSIPNSCPQCYTASDFAHDNPNGIFVLGFGGHTATVVNGCLMDAWDSSEELPQFVLYRRE